MKTFKTIFAQKPVFLHNWEGRIDVIGDFENIYLTEKEYRAKESPYQNREHWLGKKAEMDEALKKYEGVNILFAVYDYINYSGQAFVLFERGGKLYEVNGGHCSCYGLEGQWAPEETTLESLHHRLVEGEMGRDEYEPEGNYADELMNFLGIEALENIAKGESR